MLDLEQLATTFTACMLTQRSHNIGDIFLLCFILFYFYYCYFLFCLPKQRSRNEKRGHRVPQNLKVKEKMSSAKISRNSLIVHAEYAICSRRTPRLQNRPEGGYSFLFLLCDTLFFPKNEEKTGYAFQFFLKEKVCRSRIPEKFYILPLVHELRGYKIAQSWATGCENDGITQF